MDKITMQLLDRVKKRLQIECLHKKEAQIPKEIHYIGKCDLLKMLWKISFMTFLYIQNYSVSNFLTVRAILLL